MDWQYKTPEYVWGDNGPSGILTYVNDLHKFVRGSDAREILKDKFA